MGLLTGKRPKLGPQDGRLRDCPPSPNCVCSGADATDSKHAIPPIEIRGDAATALARLAEVLDQFARTTIVERTDTYLRAECSTWLLRFTDDVEFLLNADAGVIHVRSASRLGHYDFGANRRRIETIRRRYIDSTTPGDTATTG